MTHSKYTINNQIHRHTLIRFILFLLSLLIVVDVLVLLQWHNAALEINRRQLNEKLSLAGNFCVEAILKNDYVSVEQFLLTWAESYTEILQLKAFTANDFAIIDFQRDHQTSYSLSLTHQAKFENQTVLTINIVEDQQALYSIQWFNALSLISLSVCIVSIFGVLLWYSLKRTAFLPLQEEVNEHQRTTHTLYARGQQLQLKIHQLHAAMDTLKQMQNQLVHSEKMASLGQLVTSVAHEVNTPLGAIKSSANIILANLKTTLRMLPNAFDALSIEHRGLFIQMTQCSLENKEYLSSTEARQHRRRLSKVLKPLLQDQADEIADVLVDMQLYNNVKQWLPLLQHPDRDTILQLANKLSEIERFAEVIDIASDKASKVVLALKTYAHPGQPDVFSKIQVQDGIETVLTLYNNFIKQGVDVRRDFTVLPDIMGSTETLNQVWTNIIHNALQAMKNKGKLEIRGRTEKSHISIEFEDNGSGIPIDLQDKVFEPFFTTKASGEGTGIGLDISRKIIEKHHGKLSFISKPGSTVFRVELPMIK